MNKYQKTAIVEILAAMLVAALVGFTLSALSTIFTASQILFGLGMILMAYCFYTLYQLRVDQLKTLDELKQSRK